MRRLLALLPLIAVCGFMLAAAPAASASFSCTPTANHGGEHAPQFTNGGISIYGPVQGGYNCTKDYTADVYAEYEFQGTWHHAFNVNGQELHLSHGPYNANEGHLWTEATQTPVVGSGIFNPCHYNWRYADGLSSTDGFSEVADVSPELFNTC
jgi:hypothetical protein